MNLNKVFSISDYRLTEIDKIKAYLKGFGYEEYENGKIYHAGERIVRIFKNDLSILRCTVIDSSDIFNVNEWKEVTFAEDIERWVKLPETSRVLIHDIGELKAYTNLSGRYLYDIIEEMLFGTGDIDFLNNTKKHIDRTITNDKVDINIKYREKSKQIIYIKFIYDGKVMAESTLPSNELEFIINYDGADDKHYVHYEVLYDGDDTPSTGIALTIQESFPIFVGVFNNLNNPLASLEKGSLKKMIVEPNSEIEYLKENNEYGYIGILVLNDEWRQLTKCMQEDYLNITDSISIDYIKINGYEYKMIYTFPTMLKNLKVAFSFEDTDL